LDFQLGRAMPRLFVFGIAVYLMDVRALEWRGFSRADQGIGSGMAASRVLAHSS